MSLVILKYYLAINGLIVAAYISFKSFRYLLEKTRWPKSYLVMNRIAQGVLLTAVLSPLLFSLFPANRMPKIRFEIRTPFSETLPSSGTLARKKIHEAADGFSGNRHALSERTLNVGLDLLLFFGWTLGFSSVLLKLVLDIQRLRKVLRNSLPIRQIGRVRILISEDIKIPFSTRIGSAAMVVVPAEVAGNAKYFRMTVNHEIHHHRNGDTIWVLIAEALICGFYLNPWMYMWKKEITELQEFACDEFLISRMRVSKREYGQCLVSIAEGAQGLFSVQVGTTCMGAGPRGPHQLKSFLRRRIEVFQDHKNSPKRKLVGCVLGTLLVSAVAGVSYGAQMSLREDVFIKPNSGSAAYEPDVQRVTEAILKKYVTKFKAEGGFILVTDTQTGKVLAVANESSDPNYQKKSWSLSYQLEPASVMKGLTVAKAIDKNAVQTDEVMDCENGVYNYGGHIYHDWKAFHRITVSEAIMNSSNICGIKIGQKLGAKELENTLKDFGFGAGGVASQFPEASPGNYPQVGDIPDTDFIPMISTGYASLAPGFSVTPLEILQAYAAIANDGKLMKPWTGSGVASEIRQVVSAGTASKTKEILRKVVTSGTGKNAESTLYTTAGKTSTAYHPGSPEHNTLGGHRGIAGFAGFAPVQNPRLAVYVGIIDPTNSEDRNPHGGEHAAPVFKEVIETLLQKMKVAADR